MSTSGKSCKGFYAYSANPRDVAETIENAINRINQTLPGILEIRGWKSSVASGTSIIHQICSEIEASDLFLCDLTTLSMNVLFELGYAIAKKKRIWITLCSSNDEDKRDYKRLSPLSQVARTYYRNSHDLQKKFLDQEPYQDLDNTIYESFIVNLVEAETPLPHLFYLKCSVNTEASVQLTQHIKKLQIQVRTDDPEETPSQTLEWYAKNVYSSQGVVAHFVSSSIENETNLIQNSKYALVSGLAYGLDIPLLMLAHSPFNSPVDFQGLLTIHETASSCMKISTPWIDDIASKINSDLDNRTHKKNRLKETIDLRKVSLGQYVAENERERLSDYFVTTAPYKEALRTTQYLIYVGRKGTGKTANLFQLEQELRQDKRTHVCLIQPVDYELEGVTALLTSNISKTNPGYLSESLWKYLVYTELAANVYEEIKQRPSHVEISKAEQSFCNYVDSHKHLITSEFTDRMEYAIRELCAIEPSDSTIQQRAKVSEILHNKIISELRKLLGDVLENKEKVVVLVDNLDKAWRSRSDLDILADFLYGLLGAGQKITSEFQKRGSVTWKSVNLVLIIFLRSDIYSYIVTHAREGDKISAKQIRWDDPLLLQRIIEERFLAALEWRLDATQVWETYFLPEIKGTVTKDYITSRIIPRPRDMIFFCSAALDNAINHRHSRIELSDINQAERNYSEHVFETLLSETKPIIDNIEDLLYEFAGAPEIIDERRIKGFMTTARIPPEKHNSVIELLSERAFLGLETERNNFVFLYDEKKMPIIQKQAERIVQETGVKRYKINIPFHSFLDISK